jgi:hypothetical protein
VLGVVAGLVVGTVAARVAGPRSFGPGMIGSAGEGSLEVHTREGKVSIDTARLKAMARQMEAAAQAAKATQVSDTTTAAEASGTPSAEAPAAVALSAAQLRTFLPEALGELHRVSIESMGDGQAMPAMATATYGSKERRIELSLVDVGAGTLGAATAMWSAMNLDRDTATQTERIYREGDRAIHEQVEKDGSRAHVQVVLKNGTMLGADGHRMDLATVRRALAAVDMSKIEGLPRPAAR